MHPNHAYMQIHPNRETFVRTMVKTLSKVPSDAWLIWYTLHYFFLLIVSCNMIKVVPYLYHITKGSPIVGVTAVGV